MLDAAAALSPEELTRDFGTADKTVAGTLVHVFAADRSWLARLHGQGPGNRPGPEFLDLPVLREGWAAVHANWQAWGEKLTDDGASAVLNYHDLKGNAWRTPVWQIVLHVVNHATHHRGQAAGFLRSMGHTPPPLDLIAYYRGLL